MTTITQEATPVAATSDPSAKAVIGIEYDREVYLYDAAEFRVPGPNEVWAWGSGFYVMRQSTWKGRTYFSIAQVLNSTVERAYNANRYWPGDDVMAMRELDADADAFLMGGR